MGTIKVKSFVKGMPDINYYKVGGSLEYQHPTYVVRQADAQLYQGLINGEFCYVLNSRQMGKSSLRVQMTKKLKAQGVKCAAIDMTRIGSHVTPEEWYGGLVSELLRGFRLSRKINFSNWWRDREVLSPVQRLSEFIDDVLLIELSQNIVIFIDEIDSIIKIPFRDDFFAFIRACYNQRVDNPDYQRLTFCLLGVATPSDLIADRTLSTPFNIGTAIELTGFHLDEVNPLVQGLEPIVSHPMQVIAEVLEWTGGQPFLTQKLCKLIVQESESDTFKSANGIEALVRENIIENWEVGDEPEHLRTIRDRIKWSQRQKPLLLLYQQILHQGEVKAKDTPEQMELRLSGLVVKQQGKLKVANRIYQAVFNQKWLDELFAEAGIVPETTPATVPKSVAELEQIEQMAKDALQQFKYKQIEALSLALQAGYTLKGKIPNSRLLSDFPYLSAVFALQKILQNIYERNRFSTGQGMVQDVCFSPDGECLVTAGGDGTVKLWNRFGQRLREWQGHQGIIYDVSFSANGQFIATAGRDGFAKVWHISGQQITQVSGHQGSISTVRISPDDSQILTVGRDGTAKLWNLSGEQLAQLKSRGGTIWAAQFSANGQYIATAGTSKWDGLVIFWNRSGESINYVKSPSRPILSLQFSPDGKFMATAHHDGTVQLWNLSKQQITILTRNQNDGQQITLLNRHQKSVRSICFSPDGQRLATVSGGIARVWNLSGKLLAQLNENVGAVLGLSFSPDSQRLATAGVDGNLRFWDLSAKHLTGWNTGHGTVYLVRFTPSQKHIFTVASNCKIGLWNLKGKQLAQLDDPQAWIRNASFSPGMHYIVTAGADGKVRLWRVTWQLSNSDQKSILSLSDGNALRWQIKNLADEELGHCDYQTTFWYEFQYSNWVNGVSCSPDWQSAKTERIATAAADGMVCIWGLSGNVLTQWNTNHGELKSISFHPDGQRIVTAGVDGTVCFWDLSGRQLGEWKAHQGEVTSISCSPDGQIIATAGREGIAKLWTIYGQRLAEFKGHQGAIRTVSFCGSGKGIATAGDDGTVQLWRVEGLEELLARGCDWLEDYWVTYPEALRQLEAWQNRVDSSAVELNQTEKTPQRLVTQISDSPQAKFLGEFTVNHTFVRVYHGDMTNLVTDVMVSSDDTNLKMNGALSWRISQVGGNEIYHEAQKLSPCPLGTIAITTAGKLQAKKIFHAAVIDWHNEILPSSTILRQVVHTCLNQANQYGFKSIAFPLLGTGTGGCSKQVAWEVILLQTIQDLSTKNQSISEVVVAVYELEEADMLNIKQFLKKCSK
ncbi:MAG: AAA-like domain-containing protein [Coleofasciculus sp. E2-BRE-01]